MEPGRQHLTLGLTTGRQRVTRPCPAWARPGLTGAGKEAPSSGEGLLPTSSVIKIMLPAGVAGEQAAGVLLYLCTWRTKACTSWIRGSWLSVLALDEEELHLP